MSRITVGLLGPTLPSKLSDGGNPSVDTPPGNDITIGAAGDQPSATFQPAGSPTSPSVFVGSVPAGIAMWRPVAVVSSSTSNADDGHGVMQWLVPSGLHCAS